METKQTDFWRGEFGKNYTQRNTYSLDDWDNLYLKIHGITKLQMTQDFIGHLSKSIKILEVGCNSGQQLQNLQRAGFENLYGVELQKDAVEVAKANTQNISIIEANGFDLPFKDNYFDLIVTNGVLIHIAPDNLKQFMKEIYRCTKKLIYGFEYYNESIKEIPYRGHNGFLWKADYAHIYVNFFSDLKIVKKIEYPYLNEEEKGNINSMFLLEKESI